MKVFDTVSLDCLATFEMGQSPDSTFVVESDEGVPFLQGCTEFGAVTPRSVVNCTHPKKVCKPGDILISVRAPVGDLNKADREYCIGRGLAAVRFCDNIDANFGWHLLQYCVMGLRIVAQGSTFEAIGKNELANLKVLQIPLPEQRRIAEILDTIDEAIQKTEALISKLKAMKQGLLHDLLTRGLDKNGKLRNPKAHPEQFKNSPLGRIPREWEVEVLGELCLQSGGSVQTGPFGSQLHAKDYKDRGIPIITVEHLGDNEIIHNNLPLVGKTDYERLGRYLLKTGDLVFSRVGAIDRCAYVSKQENGWLFSGRCLRVRMGGNSIDPRFLSFQLNSYGSRKWILNHAVGSTMACLNTSILCEVPVVLPRIQEQIFIASLLDAHDAHIRAEEQYRDKLKLQKKGFMHDLLTGKVRVNMDEAIRDIPS
ncbi:MAG: hypothetical protein DRN37_05215 [Thermoplasmata archaeon]|nr:MAG: hypothetical protein DRN37_05215 [Thermoplasmata archaeon]